MRELDFPKDLLLRQSGGPFQNVRMLVFTAPLRETSIFQKVRGCSFPLAYNLRNVAVVDEGSLKRTPRLQTITECGSY